MTHRTHPDESVRPAPARSALAARPLLLSAACLASGSIVAAGIFQAPLKAQDTAEIANSDLVEDLRKCSAIADADQRLACFDTSVAAVVEASDSGEVQIVAKEEVEETRRGLFGFTLPKTGLFSGGGEDGGELTTLTSTITSARKVGRSTYVFKIAEGSTWRIASLPPRTREPRKGDAVELKKASLGTFFIRIAGNRGVKGRRVQ